MVDLAPAPAQPPQAEQEWYGLTADAVAAQLGVDPATGLTAARVAELLQQHGPNALAAEPVPPGWLRFVAQYRSYMQLILLGAAIVSIVIGQYATGAVVLALTLLNAVVGLRQEGK